MFISQSVLCGEVGQSLTAMMIRISHEISHSWFGLVIGALDWTEEWLSEVGFDGNTSFPQLFFYTNPMFSAIPTKFRFLKSA